MIRIYLLLGIFFVSSNLKGQAASDLPQFWEITDRESIVWYPSEQNLKRPYKDNIEMSGKNVSAIVYYEIDTTGKLSIEKDVIFPQLRTYNKSNEPDWKKYRAYFRRKVSDNTLPRITCQESIVQFSTIDSIEIGGKITFYYSAEKDLQLTRSLYPSMDDRLFVEEWTLVNRSAESKNIKVHPLNFQQSESGYKGEYTFTVHSDLLNVNLKSNESKVFPVFIGALLNDEKVNNFELAKAKKSREDFLVICKDNLVMESPDQILNTMFYFSKIRASESIFNSSMGLVHSPGGGNYYTGIWANDQVEYSGPFFPFMGYPNANRAAFNAYKKFLENIPKDDGHIAYAFEVDGIFPMTHLDRGDAAMIAYGTSLYLLNSGNIEEANTLWPLVEWSLNYCHLNRNDEGAVRSESDEMEGRISTGDANLSTSTLYYGGLKYASRLAKALNYFEASRKFRERQNDMAMVIENYFGSSVNGLNTYKYFKENKNLRHWICLPLTMGITERKESTLEALFEKLWTENGVLVEYKTENKTRNETFWDRATLYALRGALKVGMDERAFSKLKSYSKKRLLGDHVPYAVEAFPENNMKHLSAESALYARIYIEGLLGYEPQSLSSIAFNPKLPKEWNEYSINRIFIMGKPYKVSIQRNRGKYQFTFRDKNKILYDQLIDENESVIIELNN